MKPTAAASQTPRSDKAKCKMNICMTSVELDAVPADFARTLEAENSALVERLRLLTEAVEAYDRSDSCHAWAETVEAFRYEAILSRQHLNTLKGRQT